MKTFLTLTFLVVLLSSCGSSNEETLSITTTSDISQLNICNKTVDCVNQCVEEKCEQACYKGLNGDQIAKSNILDTCLDSAYQCVTEECKQSECTFAMDICSGVRDYGCAQVYECSLKCQSQRCEDECNKLASPKAKQLNDDILECVTTYCLDAEDILACLNDECGGEFDACFAN